MTLSSSDVRSKLESTPQGALLFVSYLAGREPKPRAILEAAPAIEAGMARRHFFGKLENLWVTKKGELVFTVLCDNRTNADTGEPPNYRTFNPCLGTLLGLEVIS